MPRPTVVAVRQVAFEDLGSIGAFLETRGFALRYLDAPLGELHGADLLAPDLLVVLGGPIGANDEAEYPFLQPLLAAIRARLERDLPLLGVCLGAQLMARALGARVYPAAAPEIGWAPLQLTPAGLAGPLRHLDGAHTPVLHWHGDTFDIPPGCDHLAATAGCANQAFARGRALALQFHPEVTAAGLEAWYVGHALEIHVRAGVPVGALRADARRYAPALERHCASFMGDWLAQAGA